MRLTSEKLFLMNKKFSFEDKSCDSTKHLDTHLRIKVFSVIS